MKNTTLTILLALTAFVGINLALMQIYSTPDGMSYPLNGSIEYLGTSLFAFAFLYNLDSSTSIVLKWINILISAGFSVLGVLLALICLYALPLANQVEPLASTLFVVSGMIASSGIFFLSSKMRLKRQ